MKCFILRFEDHLTARYHSGGAAVVFAESEERARALMQPLLDKALAESYYDPHVDDAARARDKAWSSVQIRPAEGAAEEVFIFADAGCC